MTDGTPTPTPESTAAPVSAPAATAQVTPAASTPAPDTPTASAQPEAAAQNPATSEPQPQPSTEPAEKPAEESLLGQAAPKPEEKKDATTPAADAPVEQKKEEGGQSAEPAPLPTYEAFELPEGIQFDEKELGELTKVLGEFELDSKADHAKVHGLAQKLITQHVTALTETVNRINDHYVNAIDKQKTEWKEAIQADPELGGNRTDTTKANVQRFLQAYGGTPEDRAAFSAWMNESGVGNYPPLVRMIAKAGEMLAEGTPLPATRPPAARVSPQDKRYGAPLK